VVLNGPREYGNPFFEGFFLFFPPGGMDVFVPLQKTIFHFVIVFLLYLVALVKDQTSWKFFLSIAWLFMIVVVLDN